jgi:hypothetical protein
MVARSWHHVLGRDAGGADYGSRDDGGRHAAGGGGRGTRLRRASLAPRAGRRLLSRDLGDASRRRAQPAVGGAALVLGVTTNMAFSPTDVMPMARWAKLTMTLQSVIALVVIGLVIARAVNILT